MTSPRIELLLATCALGAVAGLFIGFTISIIGFGAAQPAGALFTVWISEPQFYWPWPVLGALIGLLILWLGALIRGY